MVSYVHSHEKRGIGLDSLTKFQFICLIVIIRHYGQKELSIAFTSKVNAYSLTLSRGNNNLFVDLNKGGRCLTKDQDKRVGLNFCLLVFVN